MKAVRKVTTAKKLAIQDLVEITKDFLPLSTYRGKGITFQSIFKESKVDKYLQGNSKVKKLQNAWENIYRYKTRLPTMLIRKIIPAAVDYRKNQRNPLKIEEIEGLNDILLKLGLDMSEELLGLDIDQNIPEIIVPPAELVSRLENHPLHDEVRGEVLELFRNGHFNESIRKASEKFEVYIQRLSNETEIGKGLMGKVFKLPNPVIQLNSLTTENEKGIQEGFQLMTMGMMRGIRNIFSHGDENQRPPEECFEILMYINWLFKQLP